MSDDSKIRDGEAERVGYRRPPRHTRFQKGNRANPRGRGNRDRDDFAKSVQSTLSAKVEIRERGRKRFVTRSAANILTLFERAKRGDAGAADRLLTLHELSSSGGDAGPSVIEIHNALPDENGDYRDQLVAIDRTSTSRSGRRNLR
jgi:hypothetical protein